MIDTCRLLCDKELLNAQKLIIWCRGPGAIKDYLRLKSWGGQIVGFTDSFALAHGETFAGLPVIPYKEALGMSDAAICVTSEGRETIGEIFARIRTNGADLLTMPRCTGCGECEARCTQKIDIRERFRWLYDTAEQYGYTVENIRARFSELERLCANEEKVAIWPSSQYASKALDFWANPEFEAKCEYFNDSENMWGTYFRGKIVRRPDELVPMGINIIIITHFKMGDIIYNNLRNTMPDHVLLITMWGGGGQKSIQAVDWFCVV